MYSSGTESQGRAMLSIIEFQFKFKQSSHQQAEISPIVGEIDLVFYFVIC